MNSRKIEVRTSFYILIYKLKNIFLADLSYKNNNLYLQIINKKSLFNKRNKTDSFLSVFFLQKEVKLLLLLLIVFIKVLIL